MIEFRSCLRVGMGMTQSHPPRASHVGSLTQKTSLLGRANVTVLTSPIDGSPGLWSHRYPHVKLVHVGQVHGRHSHFALVGRLLPRVVAVQIRSECPRCDCALHEHNPQGSLPTAGQ